MRAPVILACVLAALGLTGCATMPMAEAAPSMETLQSVNASGIAPIRVGDFKPGPGLSAGQDRSIGVRAGVTKPPNGNSFSAFLGETLAAELHGGGKLSPNSDLVMSGALTESKLDGSGVKVGKGSIAARFVLTRKGTVVYDKLLRADAEWESNFIGALAIPAAINGYNSLYPKLVRTLLQDPDFVKAAQP